MSTILRSTFLWKQARIGLVAASTLLCATGAMAGIHTWGVVEVFSNANGTVQYIELFETGTVTCTERGVGNGSLASNTQSMSWSNGLVATPTCGKSYLIATEGFVPLTDAPTPDVIIPADKVPFFDTAGDTITFAANGGGLVFSFDAVPINGTDSLDKTSGEGVNTPKNYADETGSVVAPNNVPSWSGRMVIPTVSLLLIAGIVGMRRRRVAVARTIA